MGAQLAIVYLIQMYSVSETNVQWSLSGLWSLTIALSVSCVKKPLRNSFFVEFIIVRAK